jgi:hypothetical protein
MPTPASTDLDRDPGPRCRRCGEPLKSYSGTGTDLCEDCLVSRNAATWHQGKGNASRRRQVGTGRAAGGTDTSAGGR